MSTNIASFLYSVTSLTELKEHYESEMSMMEYKGVYIIVCFSSTPVDECYEIYLYSKRRRTMNEDFIKNIACFEYHGDDFVQDGYDFDRDSEKLDLYIYNYAKKFIDGIK